MRLIQLLEQLQINTNKFNRGYLNKELINKNRFKNGSLEQKKITDNMNERILSHPGYLKVDITENIATLIWITETTNKEYDNQLLLGKQKFSDNSHLFIRQSLIKTFDLNLEDEKLEIEDYLYSFKKNNNLSFHNIESYFYLKIIKTVLLTFKMYVK